MAFLKKFWDKNQEPDRALEGGEDLPSSDETGEEGELSIDMYQDKDHVVIKSTIAGVSPEDLDITIANDMVTIRGERRQSQEVNKENYYYQECYWGSFSRSIMLPVEVDVDKATAELKDGILTVTLPKASRARTKKVKVKSSEV